MFSSNQVIICVEDNWSTRPCTHLYSGRLPRRGQVFSVRRFIKDFWLPGFVEPIDGVWLNEVTGDCFKDFPGIECGLAAFHFMDLESYVAAGKRRIEEDAILTIPPSDRSEATVRMQGVASHQ
jgi:hypothetical protein